MSGGNPSGDLDLAPGLVTLRCRFSAETTPLVHHWERVVGSGHASLALRADWQAQLLRAHEDLGFERVRFHGILSDDMGTLVEEQGRLLYSFHNADLIMDYLLSIGMRPLVELSFMPTALASGDKTVFSYAANVTPPKDLGAFQTLVGKLARHWQSRYGQRELDRWMFEVWNEPNLESFWTGGRQGYFDFYRATAQALKEVSPSLRVGGPATAKAEWLPDFVAWCTRNGVPLDFLTTHVYPTDALGGTDTDTTTQLAKSGRDFLRRTAERTHREAAGLPIFYTEWSITSNPRDPLHDEPYAAAYLTKAVLDVAGLVDGYSHWTFTDVFAENYFPSKPFHGGFGLMTLHGVPKPAYRAFQLLHRLGEERLEMRGSHPTVEAWAVRSDDQLTLVVVNLALPGEPIEDERVRLRIDDAPPPRRAFVERIDDDHANPRRRWADWGEPDDLDRIRLDELLSCSVTRAEPVAWAHDEAGVEVSLTIPRNGLAFVTLELDHRRGRKVEEPPTTDASVSCDAMLDGLQAEAFSYFQHHVDRETGLVSDSDEPGAPASIAATGLALASYGVAAERGLLERTDAAKRALLALRFLWRAPQGEQLDATGYRGFFYHFLHGADGRRARECELSTIDTTLLIAGGLMAAQYFDREEPAERELRKLADDCYRRVDWAWALAGGSAVSHGWMPVTGFLPYRWQGYSEALLLYVLALGSPTHPAPAQSFSAWTGTYRWREFYGERYLHAAPLFIHQLSHCWLDLRGIQDAVMRNEGLDYFENSRRATRVQQRYAIDNPGRFSGYGEHGWGITASSGPGPVTKIVDGRERKFLGYAARGAPDGPDDGSLSPWAVVASLPFAPEIVVPTIESLNRLDLRKGTRHGYRTTYNPTFGGPGGEAGWVSEHHYGLNQGPAVLMIENHRSGLPWALTRRCPYVVEGLRRAGFSGGWLGD